MKKQQKLMEQQYAKMQEEMQKAEYKGSSGNGLVEIIISGEKNVKSIKIKPECVDQDDVEGLQDLIMAAFQNASEKMEANSSVGNPMGFM